MNNCDSDYVPKGDKKTTFDFTNYSHNSVDYSKYLTKIPSELGNKYNADWIFKVAGRQHEYIKNAVTYLIKKKNDIIKLNAIGIDSGKMISVYKSKYPYITTGLLAKNVDILKKMKIKNRNMFLNIVLKEKEIEKIEKCFKILNQQYDKKMETKLQNNATFTDYMELDDNNPLLPNSKNPTLTSSIFEKSSGNIYPF